MNLIGLTGPSSFTNECTEMIENFFQSNFVLLYQQKTEHIDYWLEKCDAIICAGGVDIHPAVYGNNLASGDGLSRFDIDRDIRELHIIDYCIKNKKPMLGICRGHQLIGVYHNITLIPNLHGWAIHSPTKSGITLNRNEPCHAVDLLGPNTKEVFAANRNQEIFDIASSLGVQYNDDVIWVNSFHHQGLKFVAEKDRKDWKHNVMVCGKAASGLKEGNNDIAIIEIMKSEKWLSVQWHPEYDWDVNPASCAILKQFSQLIKEKHE